ncbi:hypothetical protein GQ53DRAFT_750908 [Thozetella sp. PMI_491]|nr:hypothetical protein GQ53DRAFT_750908 [Thozetella sp. PMI_491]
MHNDILDTVLVGRKDATNTSAMKEGDANDDEAKCPVDHKTRDTWVRQARSAPAATQEDGLQDNQIVRHPGPAATASPLSTPQPGTWSWSWSKSWTGSWSGSWGVASSKPTTPADSTDRAAPNPSANLPAIPSHLGTDRVISSIPRSSSPGPSSCPVNHEQETGTSASGNWIYPSEKMFFDAMKRKGYDSARVNDMRTVVPIHNAVNERAWAEILQWEKPYVSPVNKACGGPRLHSFAGLSEKMTPKARLNTLLGYTAPFDRHDWVVDRCGTQVEYVIDFYAGRPGEKGAGKVNFFLDVRPKLNSWEGFKMRAARTLGLV